MNLISTSLVGLMDFLAKFILASFLLRLVAIKTAGSSAGQGLAALVF